MSVQGPGAGLRARGRQVAGKRIRFACMVSASAGNPGGAAPKMPGHHPPRAGEMSWADPILNLAAGKAGGQFQELGFSCQKITYKAMVMAV